MDRDPLAPGLVVHELVDGRFAERARVAGGERYAAATPFPVEVTPADLAC